MLEKYVDKLPIPRTLRPKHREGNVTYYEVRMHEIKQKLHRDLPMTTVWGYEGAYPGPTIEARRGETTRVKWMNELPDTHILPVDKTVHGAGTENPEVRTVVHLHGGSVEPESDGYPEAWFTRDFDVTGNDFTTEIYEYPNNQSATTLFYHDHALGITRLNVYAGLVGLYYIRQSIEPAMGLPRGRYEIPLLIQDKSFNEDGSLFYPSQPDPPIPEVNPSIVPEFFGDTMLVNGMVWPYLDVEPRRYRFRVVNGCNSRFLRLRFSSGQSFYQIGTDGGFLERPALLNELTLAPAERAELIVDFSRHRGQEIIITNDAPSPFPNGAPVGPETTGQVMKIRVGVQSSAFDVSRIPSRIAVNNPPSEASAKRTRDLTLMEGQDQYGRLMMMLDNKMWDDSISEKPSLGDVEIWRLINLTMDAHPMHLHLIQFHLLDRQPFDMEKYMATGQLEFTGTPIPPDPNERGWKDTIRANPGEITRIITRFVPYYGLYVWHCHILEHEDYDMMRPYKVIWRNI